MFTKKVLLGSLALLLVASNLHAGVVALKRSPGLTDEGGLSPVFSGAITNGIITVYSGQGAVADTFLYTDTGWATDLCYENSGAAPIANQQWQPLIAKFGLNQLPGFAGSTVTKAEVRFYATTGNSGLSVGYITSSDWSEGNKAGPGLWGYPGDYPGLDPATPGASGAHPNGLNTGPNQDANGVSQPSMPASWANNQAFSPNKDGVHSGSFLGATGIGSGYYLTLDVTDMAQLWASGTPNYGLFLDSVGNYNPYMSEETNGADYQPILFIDYLPHGDPTTVTDLAAGDPDWFKLDLTWTAPSANPPAPVASYDIRISTNPITDDASFAVATKLVGVPAPAAPGSPERFSVTGLSPNSTYYFAIKSTDVISTVSGMSNVASGTTSPMDVTPPTSITDLASPTIKPNYVVLTWTAIGDDGITGTASIYDLRYSTLPIGDESAFAVATPVMGMAIPKASGSAETCTVHGLLPATTYHFAIKAADEVPNWSAPSNVVTFTTLPEDVDSPEAVTDLHAVAGINIAYLSWTAPADVGTAGVASYYIRYSTAPIDEGNWALATPAIGEPTPTAPGTRQTCTVAHLTPSTTYYFAMKSSDFAEPSNVSAVSNVATATTLPPIVPVTVHNPWLVNDRVADTHNINTMAATYVNAYTPDGVIAPASDEAKAINIYNNQKRRLYHWADEPPMVGGNDINDPTYDQNVFGWCLCGRHASQACTIVKAAGLATRKIALPGHWVYEVQYSDGTYHLYDTMTTMYLYNRANPRRVASCTEVQADNSLMLNAVAENRTCPGFLLCGDDPGWYADALNHWGDSGDGAATPLWTGNMDLRLGQSFERTWQAWQNEYPTPHSDADGGNIAGPDAPYHHECQQDWQDYVNWPYWEPYGVILPYVNTSKATYRRWSNGTDTLAPDFRSAGYQAMLEPATHDLATYNADALTPELHTAAVGVQGEAIFKITLPFYLTDASFSGDFVKTNASDVCKVYFSGDGTNWSQVYDAPVGTTHVANQSLRSNVFGTWGTYYIKIQIKGTTALTDAGVSNFVVTTIFEHNKGAMAYLDKGVNNITLTFGNAAELAASGNVIHVLYKWKEFDGSGWNIAKQFDTFVNTSPATFTITTGGEKVPRTECIQLDITQPDVLPPAPIVDLAATTAGTERDRIQLTWTATGDNANIGQATRYDLRYSTSPIADMDSFNAATPVSGLPVPQSAGNQEQFTVTGLASGTTYEFALVAYDKGNNTSGLSNVVTATTGADASPAAVTDLIACSSCITRDSVQLNWTATGEDGTSGTATRYDLRYSTSDITDMASFNAAMPITGLSVPQPAGSNEVFIITGLTADTTYNFAIVVYDAASQPSDLSNVAVATTKPPRKVGDANDDGYVNVGDLQALVAAWGSNDQGGWWNWNPDCDFNTDSYINIGDLQILVARWNQ